MKTAIDPGVNGAVVQWRDDEKPSVLKMPRDEMGKLSLWLNPGPFDGALDTVYLEEMVKYAGRAQAASRSIVYGANHGFIQGVCSAFGLKVVVVPPKKWQKALALGGSRDHTNHAAWKRHLADEARKLFPNLKVTAATADALLIYEAARRGLLD